MAALWGVVPAASAASDDVAVQCRARIKASDWQIAVKVCTQAIELNPGLAEAWIDRCQAQLALAKVSEAMADCRRAVELEPENSSAYLRLADVKAASMPVDYSGALEDYAKSIALNPRNGLAYNNRGVTRNSSKDYKGALADYDMAIELDPGDSRAYFNRGETLFLLGQRELACASFRQGRVLKPDFKPMSKDFDANYLKTCK
jgi:tetratricopeptide (TPR) repeat protein